jgi:peroxiredoxin
MTLRHPRTTTLSRHLDGELTPARARRVAAHLDRCARCRSVSADLRAMSGIAGGLPIHTPPDGMLERVIARRGAGERVLLPAERNLEASRGTGRPVRILTAAGLVLAALVGGMLLRGRELEADHSELRFSPAHPKPGDSVRVEYRATGLFAGHDRLVLRGRFADRHSGQFQPVVRVAELSRSGGTFLGSFRMPTEPSFAVFAVEDTAAAAVDYNAERWELLAHGPDGRPLREALAARVLDVRQRDSESARASARELARLYPAAPASWLYLYDAENALADAQQSRALAAQNRERFRRLETERAEASVDARELCDMAWYAGRLGDTAAEARWNGRLFREHAGDACAVQLRVMSTQGSAKERLAVYDTLWRRYGSVSTQLPFSAFMTANVSGDAEALRTWSERLRATVPEMVPMAARSLLTSPDSVNRALGAEYARAVLRHLDSLPDAERGLTQTRDEQQRMASAAAAYQLKTLGAALAMEGRRAAALDTLGRALDATWDPALFRQVADIRLSLGDTAGAIPILARVAVDPATAPSFADSARQRVGSRFDPAAWERSTAAARARMRASVAAMVESRPLRAPLHLADGNRRPVAWRPTAGTPTVVALWSRYCPPSLMQMGDVEQLHATLRARGVPLVGITAEAPSADLAGFVAEKHLTFPVLHDVDREAARAFSGFPTPTYLVLDGRGRIRFESHGTEGVLRQVAFLQEPPPRP